MSAPSGYKGLVVATPYPAESGGQALNDNFIELADRVGPYHIENRYPSKSDGSDVGLYDFSNWVWYSGNNEFSGQDYYGLAICLNDSAPSGAIWYQVAGGYNCVASGVESAFDNVDVNFIGNNLRSYNRGQVVYGTETLPVQPYLNDKVGSVQRTECSVVGETQNAAGQPLRIYGGSSPWDSSHGKSFSYRYAYAISPSGYNNKAILNKLRLVATRTDCAASDIEAAAWDVDFLVRCAGPLGSAVLIGDTLPPHVGGYIDANIADASAGVWSIKVTLGSTTGNMGDLLVTLYGEANKTIYWHGQLETIEVGAVYTAISSG